MNKPLLPCFTYDTTGKDFFVNGEPYHPKYQEYSCPEDYEKDGVKRVEPMLATALETQEVQDEYCAKQHYIVEEKFDGTRATLHFFEDHCRVFSRRESVKTGWLSENTDSLPQLGEMCFPELEGTVLDGEAFIDGRPFKDVSSTLNCKWDEAIKRQIELGFITLHVFDIAYYKGVKVENMKLERRKYYLHKVMEVINSVSYGGYPYLTEVKYYDGLIPLCIPDAAKFDIEQVKETYPNLYDEFVKGAPTNAVSMKGDPQYLLSRRAYYEAVVFCGGEGVILKPLEAKYEEGKRTKAYLKIKKFITREVVITGFTEPTFEYTGKFPDNHWDYWYDPDARDFYLSKTESAKSLKLKGLIPVTRFSFNHQVGNIKYGVVITPEEVEKLTKKKKFNIENLTLEGKDVKVVEVGDCGGFDDAQRAEFTQNQVQYLGSVIEIGANEIFKDTGKLRHPRFMRIRTDKSPLSCTWNTHVTGE